MRGVITSREIICNLFLVWREFGAACLWRWLRAVMSGRPTTFLEVALRPEPVRPMREDVRRARAG